MIREFCCLFFSIEGGVVYGQINALIFQNPNFLAMTFRKNQLKFFRFLLNKFAFEKCECCKKLIFWRLKKYLDL